MIPETQMNARIVLPLVVALFAIGCGDDDEKTSKEEGTKQRPREARTFEEWKQINPKLSQYVALNEEFVPTMGIHLPVTTLPAQWPMFTQSPAYRATESPGPAMLRRVVLPTHQSRKTMRTRFQPTWRGSRHE